MGILFLCKNKSMAACDFSVPFSGEPEIILEKARRAVESQGGNFNGNAESGDFDVSVFGNRVAGSYRVEGQNLQMNIHTKPFMVPCSMIESFLVKQLG